MEENLHGIIAEYEEGKELEELYICIMDLRKSVATMTKELPKPYFGTKSYAGPETRIEHLAGKFCDTITDLAFQLKHTCDGKVDTWTKEELTKTFEHVELEVLLMSNQSLRIGAEDNTEPVVQGSSKYSNNEPYMIGCDCITATGVTCTAQTANTNMFQAECPHNRPVCRECYKQLKQPATAHQLPFCCWEALLKETEANIKSAHDAAKAAKPAAPKRKPDFDFS